MSKEPTKEEIEKIELLIVVGQEQAEQLIRKACESAENPEQLNNQVFVLRVMAEAILAHEGLNRKIQHAFSFEDFVDDVADDLYNLLQDLDSKEEIEHIGPKAVIQ